MRLRPEENGRIGAWLVEGDQVIADEVSQRIEILVERRLQLIGSADGGWSRLYLDPADGRYWELTYPQSVMHGGGPPQLAYVPADTAKIKYGID